MPGAFGTADEADAARRRRGRARHRRHRPRRRRSPPPTPYTVGDADAPLTSSPTTSASSARSCATSRGVGRGRGGPGVDRRPPTCSPASPTACSCRTGPATRPRSPYAVATRSRELLGRGAGVRHLPRPPDPRPRARRPRPSSCRSATTAATTRCATWRPAAVEITSQNHNFAVDPDSLAAARPTITHVNLNDGDVEGLRVRGEPGVQRAVPPRGRARARTTPRTCSRRVRPSCMAGDADGAVERRCPSAPTSTRSCIIGSRPDRHRPGLRVRLLGHPGVPGAARGGLPRRPRQLEPGDDHDRPRLRRRHLRRAARRRRSWPRSSSGSGPTRVLPTLGGQTGLNLAMALYDAGVLGVLGTSS